MFQGLRLYVIFAPAIVLKLNKRLSVVDVEICVGHVSLRSFPTLLSCIDVFDLYKVEFAFC